MAWYDSTIGTKFDWPELAIPMGLYPAMSRTFVAGYNPDVDLTPEHVWDGGGIYTYPAGVETFTVSSDSAEDNPAGAGAAGVSTETLDGQWLTTTDNLALDGLTPVTIGPRLRHQQSLVTGSQEAIGTIYIGSGTVTLGVPANVYGQINPGFNRTLQSIHTIPADRKAVFSSAFVASGKNQASSVFVQFRARPQGSVFFSNAPVNVNSQGGLYQITDVLSSDPFAPMTDIDIIAKAEATNTDISTSYSLLFIKT